MKDRTEAVARAVDESTGVTEADARWSQLQMRADSARPALHIDDLSGIPFLDDVVGVELYQLRARVRALDGDVFVATCPEMVDYEAYNTRLGLGAAQFVGADPVDKPIEVATACRQDRPLGELVEIASEGGLVVHPYMGIEPVWSLAADIQARTEAPVAVLGPPPAMTRLANDKVELSRMLDWLFDGAYQVETRVATTPEQLAADLRALAGRHERVALKMARCASAMGNRRFMAAEVLALTEAERLAAVQRFLADKQWVAGDEVLTVAWEDTDCSPSSQLWIPPIGRGEPRVDGVYEQLLVGPEKVFLGSVPSRLGAERDAEIARVSVAAARVYQRLGYVGRCSFDFIVADDRLRFVECNGRWGGTSTPMHLVDRLFPTGRPAYRARDYVAKHLIGSPFARLEAGLREVLFDPATGEGRFILYNVGCLPAYGKFDVIALGESVDDATRALEEELPALIAAC